MPLGSSGLCRRHSGVKRGETVRGRKKEGAESPKTGEGGEGAHTGADLLPQGDGAVGSAGGEQGAELRGSPDGLADGSGVGLPERGGGGGGGRRVPDEEGAGVAGDGEATGGAPGGVQSSGRQREQGRGRERGHAEQWRAPLARRVAYEQASAAPRHDASADDVTQHCPYGIPFGR